MRLAIVREMNVRPIQGAVAPADFDRIVALRGVSLRWVRLSRSRLQAGSHLHPDCAVSRAAASSLSPQARVAFPQAP